ncbi:MAG: DNA/RNA non-specific endonuclease [Muribaculaceae bacterium]|nr:DNA/RNA non-specific endonuclease [Muribaculaceae bacterium]
MANQYRNNSPRRRSAPRRRRSSRSSRTVLFTIFAVIAAAACVYAVRDCSLHGDSGAKADAKASGAKHYPGLELAKGAPSTNTVKEYDGFTVCFNPDNRTSDWVGWELLESEVSDNVSRTDKFWQDYAVANCPSPDDYRNSGFDKGHLCPAADQKRSASAMSDCFVMTNMTPQAHALNAGAWQTLEKKERLWAQRDSAIVIVAGPIYTDSDTDRIGKNGVRVPSSFYKVILAPYVESPRAIGFIYPNMKCPGDMANYAMSVRDVEKITGLDFFSALPDDIEDKVESTFSFTEWNR